MCVVEMVRMDLSGFVTGLGGREGGPRELKEKFGLDGVSGGIGSGGGNRCNDVYVVTSFFSTVGAGNLSGSKSKERCSGVADVPRC